jgi:O-antigen/teichoic acid export membrane protein
VAAPRQLAGAFAISALIVGSGSGVYAQFTPSMFTMGSSFFHDGNVEHNRRRNREGLAVSTAILLAMGWGGSVITGSKIPLLVSAAYAAVSVGCAEWSMSHPPGTR